MTTHNVTAIGNQLGNECTLNNGFGIGVQALLALTAFCILICKYMLLLATYFVVIRHSSSFNCDGTAPQLSFFTAS